MKQQFLDLNGLTELVTYLKKSITEQKEILPYASNKLFPSTGNVNTIYIDTATNIIYRWDESSKTYKILAQAIKSVVISESTENGKITLTVDGKKTTVPIHGLGSAAYTNSSAYSPAGHTHTKAQVGLGNVDNTADANKSVKHATTADNATTAGSATTATNVSGENATGDTARHVWFSRSDSETKRVYNDNFKYNPATNLLTTNITGSAVSASNVPWTGVTGKPSTYAPSAHNHNDSTITSLNASKLFGTIDIARLPHGALERCVIVEDDTARFALTTAKIQLGDTVKVNKTQTMYFVIDDSKLNSEAGYTVYTAGTATSVPWSGVTGKPSSMPASDVYSWAKAANKPSYTKSEVGLGNVDNTADSAKSVKYATSAGSAGSVAWANVSGKPAITGKQTRTLTASGPSGWKDATTDQGFVPDMAFMAYWNGAYSGSSSNLAYCNRGAFGTIVTKNAGDYAPASHSHHYAGSGSAGGSANSAVKLDSSAGNANTPVYFSGGKPVACSYTLGKSVPADALFTDHTYGNMKGATSSSAGSAGLVPAPNIGEQLKFLRADGAWVIPTNTTYSVGTSSYLGITKLYTGIGSATDGTMTQSAITSALNGKSPTSHTHNYAGSSSSGGAATSAIKLSTPRKIGNASFDGTADITLSQMGLNVPVEITKADYLAKKKAGTLNANTYYNVIDEYDSVNVINDSSITTNSAFSSTKSEKTYAKKSTLVTTTLTASKWTGSSAPYTYVLPVSGATTSNIVEINYASNASSQAIEAYQNAMLADGGQTTNQITIKATEKPTVDIPITIVIRNDL